HYYSYDSLHPSYPTRRSSDLPLTSPSTSLPWRSCRHARPAYSSSARVPSSLRSTLARRQVSSRVTSIPPCRMRHTSRHVAPTPRSEEHTSELQSRENLVCRLL